MTLYCIICAVLIFFLGGSYYAYRIAFYSPQKGRDKTPVVDSPAYDAYREELRRIFRNLKERPFESVTVRSYDGLALHGRYYHCQDGVPLDICFHGYRSSPLTDFCGGSDISHSLGHNLLLVDQRAHGKSQGRTITFGIRERKDVLSWVNYAVERFGEDIPIFLYGVSMGGATVLMASGEELPNSVKGIVADCPYSSPLDIIMLTARSNPLPQWLIKPFVILGAKIYGGLDIRETDAVRAVKKAKVPILIIHGEADSFVPCEMSDIPSENPRMIRRVTFPGADHGISYLVNTQRYRKEVSEFVQGILM